MPYLIGVAIIIVTLAFLLLETSGCMVAGIIA